MRKNTGPNFTLIFALVTSVFGTLAALLFSLLPQTNPSDFAWRKQLIGLAFTAICIGGIWVAFSPAKCSVRSAFHATIQPRNEEQKNDSNTNTRGHHPDCGRFSAHTVLYGGTYYCAACTGLSMGALMALFVAALHFFLNVGFAEIGVPVALAGQLGLTLGFLEFKFRGWVRLVANAGFVIGSSLILIAADQHAESFAVDLYLIGLVVLLILTRIMISQWNHSKICLECGYTCASNKKRESYRLRPSP